MILFSSWWLRLHEWKQRPSCGTHHYHNRYVALQFAFLSQRTAAQERGLGENLSFLSFQQQPLKLFTAMKLRLERTRGKTKTNWKNSKGENKICKFFSFSFTSCSSPFCAMCRQTRGQTITRDRCESARHSHLRRGFSLCPTVAIQRTKLARIASSERPRLSSTWYACLEQIHQLGNHSHVRRWTEPFVEILNQIRSLFCMSSVKVNISIRVLFLPSGPWATKPEFWTNASHSLFQHHGS